MLSVSQGTQGKTEVFYCYLETGYLVCENLLVYQERDLFLELIARQTVQYDRVDQRIRLPVGINMKNMRLLNKTDKLGSTSQIDAVDNRAL